MRGEGGGQARIEPAHLLLFTWGVRKSSYDANGDDWVGINVGYSTNEIEIVAVLPIAAAVEENVVGLKLLTSAWAKTEA